MTALTVAELKRIQTEALGALAEVATSEELEKWRVAYIGRKGHVPTLLRQLKEVSADDRKEVGHTGNAVRQALEEAYQGKKDTVGTRVSSERAAKITGKAPAPVPPGHLHPLTQTLRHAQRIFADMGFQLVEGPSLEEAKYNFDALNIGFEHPARAETDTYYIKGFPELVLRTHVSPLQVRGVLEHNLTPPLKMFYYGATYRAEKEDATHGALFQQYEFMVVSESVTLADLKAIITNFFSRFFETEVNVRFRPGYFPFVEPGLEVDMEDTVTGKGKWLEMAGAGMMHPNVLRAMNIDPEKYQGIALGGGLDRLAMLKYQIPDIRLLYSGKFEFLRQF